jgi:hypothetical protein
MRERFQDSMVVVDTTCCRRLWDELFVRLHDVLLDVLLPKFGDCWTGLRSAWSTFTAIDSVRLICITPTSHMLFGVLNRTAVPLSIMGLQSCNG